MRKHSHTAKQLKFLSPRARKLLSVLFAAGLFFLALLSLSHYVKDPETVTSAAGGGKATAGGKSRRGLISSVGRIATHQTAAGASSGTPQPVKLLLASHNRLFWYFVENSTVQVLHEGQGVHYGVFPGEHTPGGRLKTVWNVIRPHNWHPKTSEEHLVQFDADTGAEVSRVRLESRFTHDAVRRGDKVYVANTEGGEVQELSFPTMKKLRSMRLFTLRQHVNTLAPLEDGAVWVVLHNLGQSDAVKVDLTARPEPRVAATLKSVGTKSHGLVAWRSQFVLLDSENSGLVAIDPASGVLTRLWQAPASEAPPKFLKGLCVVDDVAYFGVNVWGSREARDSPTNDAELAAVDLATGRLLWRRSVPTHGLLNIVAAPHLGEQSTYRAMASAGGVAAPSAAIGTIRDADAAAAAVGAGALDRGAASAGGRQRRGGRRREAAEQAKAGKIAATSGGGSDVTDAELVGGINDTRVIAATQQLIDMGYRPRTNGRWSSGLPRLDLKIKDTPQGWEAGISLPLLRVNIEKLRERVLSMDDDMWNPLAASARTNAGIDGRKDNMNKYKPGVEALYMVFSDQSTENVYRFPYYEYFKDVVEPLIEQIVGKEDMNKVVRLQFARMKPGSEIKAHKDMGGYARFAHRIHLPVITHPNVSFLVCPNMERQRAQRRMAAGEGDCAQIPMEAGMVFELNNRVLHKVLNRSQVKRVQLVVDVAETPRTPRRLKPGTVCNYQNAVVVCPKDSVLPLS
ncbi:hypothetical protein GPECTOR_71g578 [Gonium pectorale]|uniref:Aspartyl/asparaginy/proline hydroxylase domain-containing protein n=1 Tax=Gonium pectorale TaxID=33097 RepID=A0A150G2Y7_GONPE|nr:hypothetical protein GPECTOR_71g578 [Gonium pectorale]|eukprot:KXZ44217.1 hypothetical protein GPECTOR_71g578 [Gonium pectorale]